VLIEIGFLSVLGRKFANENKFYFIPGKVVYVRIVK